MTVSSTSPLIRYPFVNANISVWPAEFSFPFLVYDEETVRVDSYDETGVLRSLVYDTDYTVLISEVGEGGEIFILQSAAVPDGYIEIQRQLPLEQDVDWVNNNALDMEILEQSFDELTMMLQDFAVIVNGEGAVINWRGTWAAGIFYNINDIAVAPNGSWYICTESHTSTNFDNDLLSGYWVLILDLESILVYVQQAEDAATAAAASASAASASQLAAGQSATDALSSANNAEFSEANAGTSAQNAANCAQDAFDSKEEAASIVGSIDEPTIVRRNAVGGAVLMGVGDTASRPDPATNGMLWYNTDLKSFEGYQDGAWAAVGGGASGAPQNPVFWENDIHVTGDYTITTGKNAGSFGPIIIDDGKTVTIPDGSVWSIV